VQLTAGPDRDLNLDAADRLVAAAVRDGARWVVLPELFSLIGPPDVLHAGAETLDGPTCSWAAATAARHDIWLLAGSFTERIDGDGGASARHHNTSCLFAPDGARRAVYRKIHLFDSDVPGAQWRESDTVAPGDEIVLADVGEFRVGLSVCFDLRFCELYRIQALRGADVAAVPMAFTERTGRDHLHVLLRARAIENQTWVVAADQFGAVTPTMTAFGRSAIVDPWGTVVATAADGDGHVVADITRDRLDEVRTQLPNLANRRPSAYRWP
jgi:predicted amidohydrolase